MQHEKLDQTEAIISYAAAFAFIVAMVGAASLFADREIVLPELAAMAAALWAFREQSWMRRPEAIFLWPSATALMGFGVNLIDIPFAAKLALVLAAMLGFFLLFRYSLAPALATGFLPIVTNATEISFLISIAVTTLVLTAGVVLFRLRKPADRNAPPNGRNMLVYAAITLASITLAALAGYPQFGVLPPVAVVVYESLHMKMYSPKMAAKQVAVLTLSAAIGVGVFLALDNWALVAAIDVLLMAALLKAFNMRVPAVYAFPLLAFVFPVEALPALPAATALVSSLSLGAVLAYRRSTLAPKPAMA